MAKLRKMLGSADAPGVVALMRQMETQSRETLARWSAGYARESLLPICLAAHPQDTLPAQLLALAMDWAEGRCDGKMVRPLLAALRDAARQETAPAVQAALRAIGTAAAVMQTPTNALGMTFYAAAALAYQTLGEGADAAAYDACAEELFAGMLASLQSVSVPEEEHPARLDWHC